MYVTSVPKIKLIKSKLEFPRSQFEVYYISLDKSINLIDSFSNHIIRGVRKIIVPPMLSIRVQGSQVKYLTPKSLAQKLIQQYRNSDVLNIPAISKLARNSSKKLTLLYDLSPLFHKLTTYLATFRNKTNNILESFLKVSQSHNSKVLFITVSPNSELRFMDALIRDLMREQDHALFNFDYLIMQVLDPKNSFSELYVVNLQNIKKSQLISFLRFIVRLVQGLSKPLSSNQKRIVDLIVKTVQKSNPELAEKIKNLLTAKPELFKQLIHKVTVLQKLIKDKSKFQDYLIKLVSSEIDSYLSGEVDVTPTDDEVSPIIVPTQSSTEDEILKKVKLLLNMIPPGIDVATDVTNKPGLHKLERKDLNIGNVFNTTKDQIEYLKTMISLFNDTYWKYMGYNVQIEDIQEEKDIKIDAYSRLYNIKLLITDSTNQVHRINVRVPVFEDGYARIGSGEYVLQHQLYQVPITSYNPHEIMLRTNYAALRVTLLTKNKIKFLETHILGVKIPSILILLSLNCSLSKTLEQLGIKDYEIIPIEQANLSEKHIFQLSKEYALKVNPDKLTSFQRSALFGLKYIRTLLNKISATNKNVFETCKYWDNVTLLLTDNKFISSLKKLPDLFIDPITKTLLVADGYPTDFITLYIELMRRAYEGKIIEPTDLTYRRVRDLEALSILLYKHINHALYVHHAASSEGKRKVSIKFDPDRIIHALLQDPNASSQFILIGQDYNPVGAVQFRGRVNYSGLDGPSFVDLRQRSLHPTYKCVIDPVDTSEGANAGSSQQFTIGANIRNALGHIDLKSNSKCFIFSPAASLIPFALNNDGNRVQMAANQLKQPVPLENSERPFVGTGTETFIARLTSDRFVVRAKVSGKVIRVTDSYIIIQSKDGRRVVHRLEKFYNTHGYSKPAPIVKEGDTINEGQVIAEDPYFFKNGFYTSGVNAKVAFMNYFGNLDEDAIIISESFARKLTSIHMVKPKYTTIIIYPDSKLKYIRLEPGKVDAGEDLVVISLKREHALMLNQFNSFIRLKELTVAHGDESEIVLLSPESGEIKDIKIYQTEPNLIDKYPEIKEYVEKRRQQIEDLKSELGLSEQDLTVNDLRDYLPVLKSKDITEPVIVIMYEIEYREPALIGDKLHNRHGNKGTIAKILPDHLMPIDMEDGKPFDILLSPFGIQGRKNLGQLLEAYVGKVVKILNDKIKQAYTSNKISDIYRLLLDVYTIIDKTNDKRYLKQIKEIFENTKLRDAFVKDIIDNGFTLIIPNDIPISMKDVEELLKRFGVRKTSKVKIPLENGETIITRNDVVTGYVYINKLEHRVKTKYSARAIGVYSGKTLQAPGGREAGGQRAGNYDAFSILGYPLPETITELYTALADDHESKDRLINDIIRNGEASLRDAKIQTSNILRLYLLGLHALKLD